MSMLVLGTKGWLGNLFYDYLMKHDDPAYFYNGDINMLGHVDSTLEAVVNFSAKASIDWCEKNKLEAFKSNVLGATIVAQTCKKANVKYVFISSACIFQSNDYHDVQYEDSTPRPGCFYTETKLMAERLINEIAPDSIIARLRLPISEIPHPRNALNKLSTYKNLVNTQESATVVEDFIPRLFEVIKAGESGGFNMVNEGTISPAELGILLGSKFTVYKKEDLDIEMREQGRAHRVSTIIGTKRTQGYLPPLREKITKVVDTWKKNNNEK